MSNTQIHSWKVFHWQANRQICPRYLIHAPGNQCMSGIPVSSHKLHQVLRRISSCKSCFDNAAVIVNRPRGVLRYLHPNRKSQQIEQQNLISFLRKEHAGIWLCNLKGIVSWYRTYKALNADIPWMPVFARLRLCARSLSRRHDWLCRFREGPNQAKANSVSASAVIAQIHTFL